MDARTGARQGHREYLIYRLGPFCCPKKLRGAKYEVMLDHYTLDCLLLEIGLWTALKALFENEKE